MTAVLATQPEIVSGLLTLVDGVQAYFDKRNLGTKVFATFNRERFRQNNQGEGTCNRVAFLFGGEDDDENLGELTAASHNSGNARNPRELFTWEKRGVCSVWAVDTSAPDDERVQIAAIENLLEQTVRAVQFVARADLKWTRMRVGKGSREKRYGTEILLDFEHKGPLYDVTYDVVKPTGTITRKDT
jgi:hypothetical protein